MSEEHGGSEPIAGRPQSPLLIVLSGPSGVGKDAVLAKLKELDHSLNYVTTLTTRQQRPKEIDGVDYHFISENEFHEMRESNSLLEFANVYGNWYGVPLTPVQESLDRGGGNP